jgi:hypothetical protein
VCLLADHSNFFVSERAGRARKIRGGAGQPKNKKSVAVIIGRRPFHSSNAKTHTAVCVCIGNKRILFSLPRKKCFSPLYDTVDLHKPCIYIHKDHRMLCVM